MNTDSPWECFKINIIIVDRMLGDEQSLKKAIDEGVNINYQNEHGWTALCVACWNRHDDIAKILIEKGADVNMKLSTKWTALHMAAENGELHLFLLQINWCD